MIENRVLDFLPRHDCARLFEHAEPVLLPQGKVLHQPGEQIKFVYFPRDAVISLVALADNGVSVEAGIVGREGLAGLGGIFGDGYTIRQAIVQVGGEAVRVDATVTREEFLKPGAFQDVVHRYVLALLNQISQTALCNRAHSVNARLSRWLLMAQDSIGSNHIALTQEFISQMLGVRRAGVTVAAGALQEAGLIQLGRGRITIVDRKGLEASACSCYGIVSAELQKLLGPAATPGHISAPRGVK